ncbi:uncharacterized protein LOC121578615 [Coregonus clupeaformis]|uniref:uncharacterized protein LOC121578615 n=1 Tax=Coregonus clupeaformis TaxID=59861 RepID=UPI001BDFCC29|nr:uncharacterized protein LOC121578615 [Coregonus clupeaformis]XP_041748914.1 uncharacterized protein LOC121578615 [Coregonus clupeaformis]
MNAGTRIGEWTNQTLKTAMGKSLDWYQEGWENNLKVILFAHNSSIQASTEYRREPQLLTEITETQPDVVEVVEPDQNAFKDQLQARTEKDVEVFDQVKMLSIKVRLNIDKVQEKQKESYRSRIKKGTKCYDIRANYLVWKKDERKARPGKPHCSFALSWGHHLLRVTSVEANNLLQLKQMDSRPLKALTPYTSDHRLSEPPRRYPIHQNQ